MQQKTPPVAGFDDVPGCPGISIWRPGSESNRRTRICSPLHDHSATRPEACHSIFAVAVSAHHGPETRNPGEPGLRFVR